MKFLLAALILFFCNHLFIQANASEHIDGFVRLDTGHNVYVLADIENRNFPTLLLLNGLTYRIGSWDRLVQNLPQTSVNIVRFDMVGQGATMQSQAPYAAPIPYSEQIEDVESLLRYLNLNDVVTIGLSYGGAIGIEHAIKYPNRIAQVVLMAPYVAPLMFQDNVIRAQIASTRMMFPLNPATDDELYDFFLRQHVFYTYPIAEPVVLEHVWKLDSVFRMVQGIRHLIVADNIENVTVPVHMMTAEFDQYVDSGSHAGLWKAIPKSVRKSKVTIGASEHKIPEARPVIAARWIMEIVNKNIMLQTGKEFFANPFYMTATAKDGTVLNLNE